jgi:hypothetical protein
LTILKFLKRRIWKGNASISDGGTEDSISDCFQGHCHNHHFLSDTLEIPVGLLDIEACSDETACPGFLLLVIMYFFGGWNLLCCSRFFVVYQYLYT